MTFGLAVVLGEIVRALVGASGITMTDIRPPWLEGTFKIGGENGFDMEWYRFLVVVAAVINCCGLCLDPNDAIWHDHPLWNAGSANGWVTRHQYPAALYPHVYFRARSSRA